MIFKKNTSLLIPLPARLVKIPVQISKNQIWIANHQIPMKCKVQNIKQTLNIKISNIKHNYNKTIIFLPQSTPSVCCGHPVRQLDWTTPAGGDLDDLSFWWFRLFVFWWFKSFVFSYLYLYCGNLDDLSFGNLYDAHLSLSFYNNKIRRHFSLFSMNPGLNNLFF